MTAEPSILHRREGDMAVLTLNRPDVLNAFSLEMVDRLLELLHQVRADGSRALLINASGRAFCTGADLRDPGARTPRVLESHFNPLIQMIFALELPVVAAVNGAAIGIGCSLALCADLVLAGRSAFFQQSFANVGLAPDGGATWVLPRLIGRARANAMLLTAERAPADLAERWGLIYRAVDDEALLDRALEATERFATGPTRAYALIRQGVHFAQDATLEDALAQEVRSQDAAFLTQDHAEAVAAIMERRIPQFRGC
nr:enoyl-CoA hydratase-related protein [uncultured Brevundimonas sp.]